MAAATVLGVQPLRTPFLDNLPIRAGKQTGNATTGNPWLHNSSSDGAGTGSFRAHSLTVPDTMALDHLLHPADDDDLDDDDLDEEDEEIDEEEEDDEEEETWQVRLT